MGILELLQGLFAKKAPAATEAPIQPATPSAERRQRPRVNAREGTRVLIIDDSPTVVAVLKKFLRSTGCETFEALDAESALAQIEGLQPELIFLDIMLPGMNGFSALRMIRRSPATRDIPVIMMSGNEQAMEQFFGSRIGADDFMKKPFSRFEVFSRIERMLDEHFRPRRLVRPLGATMVATAP
jgi:twitching motility two-component system response regulator PilH